VFGKQRAAQERALGFAEIERMIAEKGATSPLTALRTPAGTSPFDTEGTATYEKGALFLHTIEATVGREKFDAWLQSWFDRHAFQPATSEMFLADLRANLIKGDAKLETALKLDEWVYAPGLPANAAKPDPAAFAAVDKAVAAYAGAGTIPQGDWAKWTAAEQMRFLQEVPPQRSVEQLAALDTALGLSGTGNNEVRFLWLKLALSNKFDPAIPQAEQFLSRVGRNKFVTPLFKVLKAQGAWGLAIAQPLYQRTRPGYHSMTRGNVDEVLGFKE
jgi:leukotriene-A4 hydrolase